MRPKQWVLLLVAVACLGVAGIRLSTTLDAWRSTLGGWSMMVAAKADRAAPAPPSDRLLSRPVRGEYPDKPTVAVLGFGVDRDTHLGELGAAELSQWVGAALMNDDGFGWVERTRLEAIVQEHELRLGAGWSAAEALELGHWSSADLLVTGGFRDVGDSNLQRLELAVVEAVTGDRIAVTELRIPLPLATVAEWPAASLDAVVDAAHRTLNAADTKLRAARDKNVVSLLFFHNVSTNDRLSHLEFSLPQRLMEVAADSSEARLVRLGNSSAAMEEQELSLLGLTARSSDAWQWAADYYLWGQVEERDSPAGAPVVAAEDVPVQVRLLLWNGSAEPVEVTEDCAMDEVDAAVVRVADRVMKIAAAAPPPTVSERSRDAVVASIGRIRGGFSISPDMPEDSWYMRRYRLWRAQLDLAWFLNPDDARLAVETLPFSAATGSRGAPYLEVRRQLARYERVGRRFGYGSQEVRLRRLADDHLRVLRDLGKVIQNGRRTGLPADMSAEARRDAARAYYQAIARLGREAVPSLMSARRDAGKVNGVEVIDLVLDGPDAEPEWIAEAWDAWWPVVEQTWREEHHLDTPLERRWWMNEKKAERLRAALGVRQMVAETTPSVTPITKAARADLAAARALIASRTARQSDQEVEPAGAEAAAPRPGPFGRLLDDPDVPQHVKDRFLRSRALQARRFVTPAPGEPALPNHCDAPLVTVHSLQLPAVVHKDDKLRVAGSQAPAACKRMLWHDGRLVMLFDDPGKLLQDSEDKQRRPSQVVQFDPLTFAYSAPTPIMPGSLVLHDVAVVGGRRWIATKSEGLIRLDPNPLRTARFSGEHGVQSRTINHVAVVSGDRLLYVSNGGRLGLVRNVNAEKPTFEDLNGDSLAAEITRLFVVGTIALVEAGEWRWVDLGSGQSSPLGLWLEQQGLGADLEGVWADDGAFWLLVRGELIQVSAQRELISRVAITVPPLEGLVMHTDGDVIWFAYGWRLPDGPPSKYVPAATPRWRSRVVAIERTTGRAFGQFELEGNVQAMQSSYGELYLAAPTAVSEVVLIPRAQVERVLQGPLPPLPATGDGVKHYGELGWAAFRGDAARVRRLLAEGHPADAPMSNEGRRPLGLAIRGGHIEAVRALLEAGADVGYLPPNSLTAPPATLAAMLDLPEILDLLVGHGADLNHHNLAVGKAIHAATTQGSHAALRWIVQHAPEQLTEKPYVPGEDEWMFGPSGVLQLFWRRPLMIAIRQGDAEATKILLAGGDTASAFPGGPELFIPPLSYAIAHRRADLLDLLIAAGADVNGGDTRGRTPLDYALYLGDEGTARRLLEAGADPRRARAPLNAAVSMGSRDIADRILATGYDVNTADDRPMLTTRLSALGHEPLTAAAAAAETNSREIFDRLVGDPGFDLEAPCGEFRQGDAIASSFVLGGDFQRALAYVERGYSIDLPGHNGRKPLSMAVGSLDAEAVKILLLLGADPLVRDENGLTALDHADGRPVIRQVLEEHLARRSDVIPVPTENP